MSPGNRDDIGYGYPQKVTRDEISKFATVIASALDFDKHAPDSLRKLKTQVENFVHGAAKIWFGLLDFMSSELGIHEAHLYLAAKQNPMGEHSPLTHGLDMLWASTKPAATEKLPTPAELVKSYHSKEFNIKAFRDTQARENAQRLAKFEQLPDDPVAWRSAVIADKAKLWANNNFTNARAPELGAVLNELSNPPSDRIALAALRERIVGLYSAGVQPGEVMGVSCL